MDRTGNVSSHYKNTQNLPTYNSSKDSSTNISPRYMRYLTYFSARILSEFSLSINDNECMGKLHRYYEQLL
jgi:hypothetical protein